MSHVYLVYFFTGEYIENLHPVHQIRYVLLDESEAIRYVEAENERLKKKCSTYKKSQLAWYIEAPTGKDIWSWDGLY